MLVFLGGCSVMVGDPNKTVEIDESKFGRRKYHRGHPVNGQWVFGGVEPETGETFLVPVKDRSANTLMDIIHDWIESGATVISDCWGAYRNLGSQCCIAPSTTASTSLVLTPAHTSIPSRARGVQSRFSSGSNNNNINNKLIYCHCWEEAKVTKGFFLF